MGNEQITFGGVRLNKGEVLQKFEVIDRNDKKHYVVDFKNGTRVAYTGGEKGGYLTAESFGNDTKGTSAYKVLGLEIQGSKDNDVITVDNCTVIGIDVADGQKTSQDYVQVFESKGVFGARTITAYPNHIFGDGMIEADKKDNIKIQKSSMPPVFWRPERK